MDIVDYICGVAVLRNYMLRVRKGDHTVQMSFRCLYNSVVRWRHKCKIGIWCFFCHVIKAEQCCCLPNKKKKKSTRFLSFGAWTERTVNQKKTLVFRSECCQLSLWYSLYLCGSEDCVSPFLPFSWEDELDSIKITSAVQRSAQRKCIGLTDP